MTSNDLKTPRMTSKASSPNIGTVKPNISKKNQLKSGGNIEINDEYLDEILHKNNFQIELAIQAISNDKTVRIGFLHSKRFKRIQLTVFINTSQKRRNNGFYDAC